MAPETARHGPAERVLIAQVSGESCPGALAVVATLLECAEIDEGLDGDARLARGQGHVHLAIDLDIIEPPLEVRPVELRDQVRRALQNTGRHLVLAIDGLDEIEEAERQLTWLPRTLPANVRVIATTRPETMLGGCAVAVNPDDTRYKHLIGELVELPLTGEVEEASALVLAALAERLSAKLRE